VKNKNALFIFVFFLLCSESVSFAGPSKHTSTKWVRRSSRNSKGCGSGNIKGTGTITPIEESDGSSIGRISDVEEIEITGGEPIPYFGLAGGADRFVETILVVTPADLTSITYILYNNDVDEFKRWMTQFKDNKDLEDFVRKEDIDGIPFLVYLQRNCDIEMARSLASYIPEELILEQYTTALPLLKLSDQELLFMAVKIDSVRAAREIIDYIAKKHEKERGYFSALMGSIDQDGNTLLSYALLHANADMVKLLLRKCDDENKQRLVLYTCINCVPVFPYIESEIKTLGTLQMQKWERRENSKKIRNLQGIRDFFVSKASFSLKMREAQKQVAEAQSLGKSRDLFLYYLDKDNIYFVHLIMYGIHPDKRIEFLTNKYLDGDRSLLDFVIEQKKQSTLDLLIGIVGVAKFPEFLRKIQECIILHGRKEYDPVFTLAEQFETWCQHHSIQV